MIIEDLCLFDVDLDLLKSLYGVVIIRIVCPFNVSLKVLKDFLE